MDFRVNLTIEVDQVGNGLRIQTPVEMQLIHHRGKWSAESASPMFSTPACDTLQEAVVYGARAATAELQAAVLERPLVVGRITPDSLPHGFL